MQQFIGMMEELLGSMYLSGRGSKSGVLVDKV